MATATISVDTGTGPYEVILGRGLLADLPQILERAAPAHCYAVITDSNVEELYGRDVVAAFDGKERCAMFSFPAGESNKRRKTWGVLTDQLLDAGFGRDTVIVALGGGVTGDMAGFVAATFLRGVPYVQVPTSLLAMIDSSIGGKTGVDTSRGKNLVGSFHQPAVVVIDGNTLETLPDRHIRAGTAEAIKHGAIADAGYLDWIVSHRDAVRDCDVDVLLELVRWSIEIKSRIVAEDETEQGRRAILNFGHTVGHGLEALSNFDLLHGEAVAIGMIAESELGISAQITEKSVPETLRQAIEAMGLPTRSPLNTPPESLIEAMQQDKKNRLGKLRFTLLDRIGEVREGPDGEWTHNLSESAIFETFSHIM